MTDLKISLLVNEPALAATDMVIARAEAELVKMLADKSAAV